MREKRQKMLHDSKDDTTPQGRIETKLTETKDKDKANAVENLSEIEQGHIVDEERSNKSQEKTTDSEMGSREEESTRRGSTDLDLSSELNEDDNKGDVTETKSSKSDEEDDDLDRQLAEIDALINS